MPLDRQESFLTDPVSTSPARSPSPVIKRAARTYGRPKPAKAVHDDVSAAPTTTSSELFGRLEYEDIPSVSFAPKVSLPSPRHNGEDDELADDEQESQESNLAASSSFEYDWKKKLKDMDEASDDDMPCGAVATSTMGPASSTRPPPSHANYPSAAGGSRSPPDSPRITASRRKPVRTTIPSDSESEQTPARNSPFTSPTKPAVHTSASSPPTSADEGLARRKVQPASSEVRHKETGLRRDKKTRKVKAPTKKELKETHLNRYRMAADQSVSVSRGPEAQNKYTISSLLHSITQAKPGPSATLKPLVPGSSDPIMSFSSPGTRHDSSVWLASRAGPSTMPIYTVTEAPRPETPPPFARHADEESEPDLPSPSTFLRESKQKHKTQALQEVKIRAMENRAAIPASDSDSDLEIIAPKSDDMHIVAAEEAEKRKTGRKSITTGKKRQMTLARIPIARAVKKDTSASKTPLELNQFLTKRVEEQNALRAKKKEEEWVRRGGKTLVEGQGQELVSSSDVLKAYTKNGFRMMEKDNAPQVDDPEPGDNSDSYWDPQERGSRSPSPSGREEDAFMDTTMVEEETQSASLSDDEKPAALRPARKRRVVVGSDSEEEGSTSPKKNTALQSRDKDDLGRRGSLSSLEERIGDETDKENVTPPLDEPEDDKENQAIIHQPPASRPALGPRPDSLFGLEEGVMSRLSMSGEERSWSDELDDEEFGIGASILGKKCSGLQSLSSSATLLPSPSLKSPFDGAAEDLAFSQSPTTVPLALRGGFSQLFGAANEENGLGSGGFDLFKKRELAKEDTLDLTQEAGMLLKPQVSEKLQQQADSYFDKEQGLLLAAANDRVPKKKDELFVNEHGFLTQTRPAGNAEVYHGADTPSQALAPVLSDLSTSSLRRPLRTLSLGSSSFGSLLDTPLSEQPRRRLFKRASFDPEEGGYRSGSASPPPPTLSTRTAFNELLAAQKALKQKKPLVRSEYVEQEAQESDEDEMFGFGKKRQEDDEDGEDLDRTLETLVNDEHMDDDTIAAEKVMEKYQEHVDADDDALMKLHLAAAQGDIRKRKRQNGMDMDDSDDDDEENEERNRRIRQGMNKQHKIDRSDIKALGESEDTLAFYKAYESGIRDEDHPELLFLQQHQETQDVLMLDASRVSEDEEDGENHFISTKELLAKIREPEQDQNEPNFHPNDISWIDADGSDEEHVLVKVTSRSKQTRASGAKEISAQDEERMQKWARAERKMGKAGTGRSGTGSAITGHARVKAGQGSLRNKGGEGSSLKPRPPQAAPSGLKAMLGTKRDRFQ